MNTITMYELLGLINDNKAPKKIKISELIYDFDDERQMYFDEDINELSDNIYLTKNLNHPVEILEEEPTISKLYINNELQYDLEEEKKIPEKEDELIEYNIQEFNDLKEFVEITTNDVFGKINKIINKQNKIIDYFEYLKNKGDE